MSFLSNIRNLLRCQAEIFALKFKLYALHQKQEEAYLQLGEETYLFFQEDASQEIKEDGRVNYLLEQIKKDNEMIFETEQEICETAQKISSIWDNRQKETSGAGETKSETEENSPDVTTAEKTDTIITTTPQPKTSSAKDN